MRTVDSEVVEYTKKKHPEGTIVELILMKHKESPPIGSKGRVITVDDMGTIHTEWENGSNLGLIPGEDRWKVLHNKSGKHYGK